MLIDKRWASLNSTCNRFRRFASCGSFFDPRQQRFGAADIVSLFCGKPQARFFFDASEIGG
jgi:hypothetical protein